jgi:hypothetical protein
VASLGVEFQTVDDVLVSRLAAAIAVIEESCVIGSHCLSFLGTV